MNTIDPFFQWLLDASLRASVLALVVLGLQFAFGRWLPARWRHAMWLPVVLVLLAPVLPESLFSIENRFQEIPSAMVGGAVIASAADSLGGFPPVAMPETVAGFETAARKGSWKPTARQGFVAAWLLGASAMLVGGIGGYRRSLRRIARGKIEPAAGIHEAVARAARQLGVKGVPRILCSTAVDSPAVAGFLRPVLLLPADFPAGSTANEARLVLLHELTHLKRHDLPLNWLLCSLQALHWFNPLLWLAFARMRADRETACDAQVLGAGGEDRRADYGHALLKLQGSVSRPGPSLAFVGIFGRAGMRSRIRAIARHRRSHPAWGVAAAGVIAALTLAGATRAQDPKAGDPENGTKAVPSDVAGGDGSGFPDQGEKGGRGRFVSFEDGTLTLKGNGGGLAWKGITDQTEIERWDEAAGKYVPSGPSAILGKVEAGTWIIVSEDRKLVLVGARKGRSTGTFVSYKDDRLLMLGKDLGETFTKKYGNQLHFNKFAEGVPVYESIDGGEYMLAGTAETILPTVKEGTILTVHAQGDDNIVRIDIGVPEIQ